MPTHMLLIQIGRNAVFDRIPRLDHLPLGSALSPIAAIAISVAIRGSGSGSSVALILNGREQKQNRLVLQCANAILRRAQCGEVGGQRHSAWAWAKDDTQIPTQIVTHVQA